MEMGHRTVTKRRVVGYRTVKKQEVVAWRTVPVYPTGNDTLHPKGPGLAAPVPHGEQPPYPPPGSPEAALLDGALLIPGKTRGASATCRRSTPRRRGIMVQGRTYENRSIQIAKNF